MIPARGPQTGVGLPNGLRRRKSGAPKFQFFGFSTTSQKTQILRSPFFPPPIALAAMGAAQHQLTPPGQLCQPLLGMCCTRSSTPGWWVAVDGGRVATNMPLAPYLITSQAWSQNQRLTESANQVRHPLRFSGPVRPIIKFQKIIQQLASIGCGVCATAPLCHHKSLWHACTTWGAQHACGSQGS